MPWDDKPKVVEQWLQMHQVFFFPFLHTTTNTYTTIYANIYATSIYLGLGHVCCSGVLGTCELILHNSIVFRGDCK